MQKSTITEFNWHNPENQKAVFSVETQEFLEESAQSHISEMTEAGYNSGELTTNINEEQAHFRCTWSVVDVSRPQDLYNHLVKNMKADLIQLIRQYGVDSKHVQGIKVLAISEYELVLAGELITTIGETKLYSLNGLEFNHCLLELDLERVLDIIEDLQATS